MSVASPVGNAECLTVVVPCYNEAPTVAALLHRVLKSPVVGEVILVDDASTDGSYDIAKGVDDPRLTVLRHGFNLGKGAAIALGIESATQPFVVVQDADLEYNPEEYGLLLEPLLDGRADVVYGSRFHNHRAHRILYFWHTIGNQVLTLASNMVTDLNLTDMETCYKMGRTSVIQSLQIEEDRFGVEPEMTAKLAKLGVSIYEVGISYDGRTYDEGKKIGWRDGVRAVWCIGKYNRRGRTKFPSTDAVHAGPMSDELAPTLDALEGADNYNRMIAEALLPHLGTSIIEVGAGTGTVAQSLVDALDGAGKTFQYVATEPDPATASRLAERFAGDTRVEATPADAFDALGGTEAVDSIVLVNVLEHIEHDRAFVRAAYDRLAPGGKLLLWVPAGRALYSDVDLAMGHYRRYTTSMLRRLMSRADFTIDELRFFNAPGALAWWLLAKKLRRQPVDKKLTETYDRFVVPAVSRIENQVKLPFGQSLLCIASKPEL